MLGPRLIAAWALRTQTERVRVHGLDHVPATGPVLLVARHYHHLLDGAVLVAHLARPVHIIVGLDWTADRRQRTWMERACRAAAYPIVLRAPTAGQRGGYARDEMLRTNRAGLRDAVALLRAGRVVLIFPEGYPNVDPTFARKPGEGFLPFADGAQRIMRRAEADGVTRVAAVPVGFSYRRSGARWTVDARIGAPRHGTDLAALETAVRALSEANEGSDRSEPSPETV